MMIIIVKIFLHLCYCFMHRGEIMRVNCIDKNSSIAYMALKPIKNKQNNITKISDKSNSYSFKNGFCNVWKFLKNKIKEQWDFVKSEFSINND